MGLCDCDGEVGGFVDLKERRRGRKDGEMESGVECEN